MDEILRQMVARINAGAFIPTEPKGDRVMAKPVRLKDNKEFQFKSSSGAASKYPWAEWFNGDILLLERSATEPTGHNDAKGKPVLRVTHKEDFDVEVDAMLPKIKTAARKRYKVVQISKLDADGNKLVDSLIIKSRDMTSEERVAEDIKRAKEKAAREAGDENETTPQLAETA